MFFQMNRLCRDITADIIIYGAGYYAHAIYDKFQELGIAQKIKAFVVTEKQEDCQLHNRPIYSVEELVIHYDHESILVATSERYKIEIRNILESFNFDKILYLSDYEYNRDDVWESYIGKNNLDYLENIEDWCIDKGIVDYNLSLRAEKNNELIVYIIGMESSFPRHIKIINALKKKGFACVVLYYGNIDIKFAEEELKLYNIESHDCSNCIEKLMYKMLQYNPLLYCIEPCWEDCSWGNIIIQQKKIFGKIVSFRYDVMINVDGHEICDKKRQNEKFFLEEADGIVLRYFYEDVLETIGIKIKGKYLQFLDYGNELCPRDKEYELQNIGDNIVKLVLVFGNPSTAVLGDYTKNSQGFAVLAKLEHILKKIKGKNCIFHLYSYYLSDEAMEECKKLESEYKEFKLWFKYNHNQVLERLRYYDYGCSLERSGKEIPDAIQATEFVNGLVYKRCAMAKHFDYIAAGLPILGTCPKMQCEYLQKYGVVVNMYVDNLDIDYLYAKKEENKKKVINAQKELSIDNQILRLIAFFKEIVDEE